MTCPTAQRKMHQMFAWGRTRPVPKRSGLKGTETPEAGGRGTELGNVKGDLNLIYNVQLMLLRNIRSKYAKC